MNTTALNGRHLTLRQLDDLHGWLADGIDYGQLVFKMQTAWGLTISSPAVTYHRQKYATRIAGMRQSHITAAAKRERERDAKRIARARLSERGEAC